MKYFCPKTALASSLLLLLSACGGSSSGDNNPIPPTASAVLSPSTVEAGGSIMLDGAGSTSPNGAVRSWTWSVEEAPENSTSNPGSNDQITTFTPDFSGSYQICLRVTDDKATSNPNCHNLTVTNPNPSAVVIPNIGAIPGQMLQLDGSGSLPPTDGNPDLLNHQWSLTSAPQDSAAAIDNSSLASPRFTPDLEGVYRFELVVHYLDKISPAAEVVVTASNVNAIPVAHIDVQGGNPEAWILGETITLDGSGSSDADGDELQYRWLHGINGRPAVTPNGSTAKLEHTDKAITKFTPDQVGDYNMELTVYDGTTTHRTSLRIKVTELPAGHVNTAPTAYIRENFNRTFEIELGDTIYPGGTYSYDAEQKGSNDLDFKWTLLSHPAGFTPDESNTQLGMTRSAKMTFPVAGKYKVQLEVFDGELWSDPVTATYTAMTGANRPPTARPKLAGQGASVSIAQTVTLDGSQSTDPDDNELTYQWTLVDRPNGSSAELTNPNNENAYFTTDVPGPYIAELRVTDSHGAASVYDERVSVMAKTENNAPVARPDFAPAFDTQQPFVIYPTAEAVYESGSLQESSLNASIFLTSDAYDPDGDSLTYLWSLTSHPASNAMALPVHRGRDGNFNNLCLNDLKVDPQSDYPTHEKLYAAALEFTEWTCKDLDISPTTAGTYTVQLLISDGIDNSRPFTFNIPAVTRSNYPTLLLEDLHASEINQSDLSRRKVGNGYRQQVFPFNYDPSSSYPVFANKLETNNEYVFKRYQLTAFDQDYTITGVFNESQGIDGYQAKFSGLTDGQVIRKGEALSFDLILSTPAALPVGDFFQNMGEGLSWNFSIAEKPGWDFRTTSFIH
ncbi:PKD domain-containing protein [Marinobacter sp.]|uniref:PKD domain-containing protein n=1 Tax=Marinobacter sp. TaxID=50741 RepID=UPI003F9DC3AE